MTDAVREALREALEPFDGSAGHLRAAVNIEKLRELGFVVVPVEGLRATDQAREDERLRRTMEDFSKHFRPPYERGYAFDAFLHEIVRAAYAEAVKPFAHELRARRDSDIRRHAFEPVPAIHPKI